MKKCTDLRSEIKPKMANKIADAGITAKWYEAFPIFISVIVMVQEPPLKSKE